MFLEPFISSFLGNLLLGGFLLSLPIIIHLINRMRHKPKQWAAMQFLLAATRSSTSHAKLRNLLILLMRMLAVLALFLFLGSRQLKAAQPSVRMCCMRKRLMTTATSSARMPPRRTAAYARW